MLLLKLNTGFDGVQKIFDNILNRKVPWPPVPSDMTYEAQDLINRLVIRLLTFDVVIMACNFDLATFYVFVYMTC